MKKGYKTKKYIFERLVVWGSLIVALMWASFHYSIPSNDKADTLAKVDIMEDEHYE